MKILHMIENYRILCKEAEETEKFEAYKAYTQKYRAFFQGVFRYLYCQPIEGLRPIIEQTDFQKLLRTAEDNYKQGMADYAAAAVDRFAKSMHADFDFTFLLGLELSNIGGCAIPADEGVPILYIGIDRPLSKEWLDLFVPHEMTHMLRHHIIRDRSSETVLSRAIEEGLASYASLWARKPEWNRINVAKVLAVSEAQSDNLMKNTDTLMKKLIMDRDKPISPETMKEYFTAASVDEPFPVVGYYVGLYLTHLSVKNGAELETLVSMPGEELAKAWL